MKQPGARRGRRGRWEDDAISLRSASMCVTTASSHYIEAHAASDRDRARSEELRGMSVDQAKLAIRVLQEFVHANDRQLGGKDDGSRMVKRDFERNRSRGRERYREREELNQCVRCDQPRAEGTVHCAAHLAKEREKKKTARQE